MQNGKRFFQGRDQRRASTVIDAGFCSLLKNLLQVGQSVKYFSYNLRIREKTYPDGPARCEGEGRIFRILLILLDRTLPQIEGDVSVPLFAHALLGF